MEVLREDLSSHLSGWAGTPTPTMIWWLSGQGLSPQYDMPTPSKNYISIDTVCWWGWASLPTHLW